MWQDKVTVIGVIIVLTLITIMLMIFMPNATCFYSEEEIGYEFGSIAKKEIFEYVSDKIDKTGFDSNGTQVLYQNGQPQPAAYKHEYLYETLNCIHGIQTAFLQEIPKKTTKKKQKYHQGSAPYANETIRCVLPMDVSGPKRSGIWVDGQQKFFNEGEWVFYDNSKISQVYNKHKRNSSYILVVDVTRPPSIPKGASSVTDSGLF